MTDEELEAKFRHIHDRFDYLMGQVEHISKNDLFEATAEAAERVSGWVNVVAVLQRQISSIESALHTLAWIKEKAADQRAERKRRLRRLEKTEGEKSVWEMLHVGDA